ncbi:MAG: glycosyltransferase family 4 protein [Chloroflexaceae bacterium]|nr:glycosyltransferase family 4 protein [Chloroflexaceae bacterium]
MHHSRLYQVSYQLIDTPPRTLWRGEALLLTLTLTNHGNVPWMNFGNHPVNLSYHWHDAQGQRVVADGLRTPLPHSLPPGHSITLEMRVESPPAPGTYQLLIDLVEEGFVWFSQRGAPPLTIPMTYQPATAPRICIINGNCVMYDAVGNHVVAELQVLRDAGYHTLLLTEFIDERWPADLRRSMVRLHLPQLQHPDQRTHEAAYHFNTADSVILTYSTYYDLAEAVKLVRNSVVIFDYHGVTPPTLWDPHSEGYRNLVEGQRHINLVAYADYAMARSEYMRNELIATGLIAPERISVTPLGTATPHPRPLAHKGRGESPLRDPALLQQYRLEGKSILLYVGRMARNKRLNDLVDALALIRQQHPETVLLLVGDNQLGPYREYAAELSQQAADLHCSDHVIFTGPVPDVAPYYDLCHIFVTASIHEGLGMPTIEAMRHGRPVVAAAAAALPETVDTAGLLFEPTNAQHLATQLSDLLHALSMYEQPVPLEQLPPWQPDDLAGRKIGLVVPRYGTDIIGGAERLMRGWAEQLTRRGYPVEVRDHLYGADG